MYVCMYVYPIPWALLFQFVSTALVFYNSVLGVEVG